ncbi:MAG: hypothetical protein CMP51_01705, partial [Flavobacteriales bacterium]|nr:hypothetical protein [Flavobacteriales bacterium]
MDKNFTKLSLIFLVFFSFGFLNSSVNAQSCDVPVNQSTTNILNFSATLAWDADSNVHHYRLRYREVGVNSWSYDHNVPSASSYLLSGLNPLINYEWQLKSICSPGNFPASGWSLLQNFTTANFPVDCNNTPNGSAFIDSCGNCVGGVTGNSPCIAFSPTVSITLSSHECSVLTDFTFSFSQDPNEPDVSSAVFTTDAGYFDLTGLSNNDTIGYSNNTAAGGQLNVSTTLLVDFVISSNKISVKSVDDITGQLYSTFTIENSSNGVLIIANSLPDNNNVTAGNSQMVVLSGLFMNPPPSTINFASTITSELGDVDVQNYSDIIDCIDCNGDFGGTAFIDSCGNCVGGNTGNVPCIAFTPTVTVSISNTDCDSISDLTISVSQDPNEPDMSTALFSSNGGYFNIISLSLGDTVGTATMTAAALSFNTVLVVSNIISSNQAIIQSIDVNTGLILGTFTISNVSGGISVLAQTVPDNNNVTSGNSQNVTFFNLFVNPPASNLVFTSTINSELGDVDIQNFPFTIICPCIPSTSTSTATSCDSYVWNGTTYTSSGSYTWSG